MNIILFGGRKDGTCLVVEESVTTIHVPELGKGGFGVLVYKKTARIDKGFIVFDVSEDW
jgi:hypothetical protein